MCTILCAKIFSQEFGELQPYTLYTKIGIVSTRSTFLNMVVVQKLSSPFYPLTAEDLPQHPAQNRVLAAEVQLGVVGLRKS